MPAQHWVLTSTGKWRTDANIEEVSPRDLLVYGNYRPDASTTGVLPGTTLTPHSGNLSTSATGQVIENLDIDGRLIITHSGVTVRNCRINGGVVPTYAADTSYGSIRAWSPASPKTTIIDCTIFTPSPNVNATCAIQTRDCDIIRCNIYGTVDGVKAQSGNVGVYGCWIHDLPRFDVDPRQTDGSHNDGIQCEGGGGSYVFRGNSIEMGRSATSCMIITQNSGPCTGLVVDKNWMYGVAATGEVDPGTGLNITEKGLGAMTNVFITNNKFSGPDTWKNYNKPALVDSNTYDLATISGNVYDTAGFPAAPIQRVSV